MGEGGQATTILRAKPATSRSLPFSDCPSCRISSVHTEVSALNRLANSVQPHSDTQWGAEYRK